MKTEEWADAYMECFGKRNRPAFANTVKTGPCSRRDGETGLTEEPPHMAAQLAERVLAAQR
jgi:hypothetical protein